MKEVLAKAESKMGKTIARLESDYAAIRAGRANPAVLDKVMVDYYGAPTPVNQLAAVSVAGAAGVAATSDCVSGCRVSCSGAAFTFGTCCRFS